MIRSVLCNYSDTYIVAKGTITFEGDDNAKKGNKNQTFQNNAPFRSCISKIHNTFVDNGEDFDTVMPMYNLLKYSDNHSMSWGSLWNYCRDEINDAAKYMENSNKTTISKPFKYKTKIIGRKPVYNNRLNTEVVIPLKYLSIFFI